MVSTVNIECFTYTAKDEVDKVYKANWIDEYKKHVYNSKKL